MSVLPLMTMVASRAVEDDRLAGLVVLVAVQVYGHARIVVERGQQVGEVAAIVEVGQAAGANKRGWEWR